MKTLIQVHRDGKFYVAEDLITSVTDQGATEKEAVRNLKKGLEEHYGILIELTPKDRKLTFIDIEVEKYVKASRRVS